MVSVRCQQSQTPHIYDAPRTLSLPEVECSSLRARAWEQERETSVSVHWVELRFGKMRTAVELDGGDGDVCTTTRMKLATLSHTLKRI